jgi:hypothetical protein
MWCDYKNSLGVPGEGVHKHFMGVAINDVLMTIIGAGIISYLSKWNFFYVLAGLFLLGIILHRMFCVRTTVDKILFS